MEDGEQQLWVFGAGGHARVVISTANDMGWRVAGIVDVVPGTTSLGGIPVHHTPDVVPAGSYSHVAIGDDRRRQRVVREARAARWLTLVHPRAYVAKDAQVGEGSAVFAMAAVQTGARLGKHVIVNTAAVVEHDNRLADFVQIATGAHLTGGVTVGTGSFVGAGAVVLPGVKVGEWCTIGAGAVVTKDVMDGTTVAGVPARLLR